MLESERVCKECGIELTYGVNWTKSYKAKRNYICKPCEKERRHTEPRKELIKLYGGCCAYCGDCDHSHLQLDHIKGDARNDRVQLAHIKSKSNKGRKIWQNALATYQPEKYQILCYRCNAAKSDGTEAEFFDWIGRVAERALQHDLTRK